MIIGFTGTHRGMTPIQKTEIERQLSIWVPNDFHHGDCIGADVQAAEIADRLGYKIHCHPPINEYRRGFYTADIMWTARSYHERDHQIVNCCEIMLAAISNVYEEQRSGTWATIRYARQFKCPIFIVDPFGKVHVEFGENGPKEPHDAQPR